MRRLGPFLFLLLPALAQADRAAGAAVMPDELMAEEEVGIAARRVPPPPPPTLTSARLEEAIEAARGEIEACLAGGSVTIRARVSRDGDITLRIRERPSSDAVEACIDLAARRYVVPLVARSSTPRAVRATVRIGSTGGTTPPPPPPVPPPVGPVDESLVHARLDTATSALLRCLASAAPGVVGSVTLTVHAAPDGSLLLESVTMPPGVSAAPALVCMGDVVSRVRVPAGGSDLDVRHTITLGG